MATYIGFSSQNVDQVRQIIKTGADPVNGTVAKAVQPSKKFKLTDEQLVINDFINSLNIPQGQKPGKPEYGTSLWSFVFEPNTSDVRQELEDEIKRVASMDPRLILNTVTTYNQESGILLELEVAVAPFNNAMTFSVFLDAETNTAFGA